MTRVAEAHIVIFPCTPSPFCIIPNFCSFSFYLFPLISPLSQCIGPMWVWPVSCCGCSRRTTWCVAVQNGTKGSAVEKGLCAASADRLTQPLPASDPLLTGSPVCQGRKKRKQRGSVHPGAEHRTLFILSPMLLPASPLPASGWLYFKIHKYSPL